MTRFFLPGANKTSILLAGVVAVSLHALFFALLHLQERGSGDSGRLRSRDNTAELLQFSSQSARSSTGPEEARALPPSPPLPPPPDRRSASLPQRTGQKRSVATTGFNRGQDRPRSSRTAGGVVGREDSPADWAQAMERLGVFLRQETAASAVGPGAMLDHANDSSEEGSSAVRLRSDPSLTQAYQSLWSQARPFVLPLRARGHKAMSVEVRQASWREVRAREIPIRHGQLLIMPEKVMLLWLEGDHLYLLQSSRQKDSKS